MRIREVGVARAEGIHSGQHGIGPALQPPRERNGKVIVIPTVGTGSGFDDARCEIAAERRDSDVAMAVGLQPERCGGAIRCHAAE